MDTYKYICSYKSPQVDPLIQTSQYLLITYGIISLPWPMSSYVIGFLLPSQIPLWIVFLPLKPHVSCLSFSQSYQCSSVGHLKIQFYRSSAHSMQSSCSDQLLLPSFDSPCFSSVNFLRPQASSFLKSSFTTDYPSFTEFSTICS